MIPQISKALASGYTSKQIIDFLKRKFPKHADQINGAVAAGFTVDQVLKFLGGGKKALATPEVTQSEGATEFQETRNRDIGRREEVNKRGLQAASLATTALAAPMAATALNRALPTALKSMTPLLTAALQPQAQVQLPQLPPILPNVQQGSQPTQSPIIPNIAQAPQPVQPEVKGINVGEILSKHDTNGDVAAMLKANNDPESIVGFLRKFRPKVVKAIEKESGQPIEKVVGDFAQETIKNEAMQPEGSIPVTKEQMEPFEAEEKKAMPGETAHQVHKRLRIGYADAARLVEERNAKSPKIEKSQTVSTPQGIGEVKEIRNGKAIVDIDGKMHKVNEDELEGEPEEVKKSTFDFDPNSIPEDLRSAPLNEVYLPSDRRHVTVKFNAGLKPSRYIYFRKDGQPIPEEYVKKIKEGIQLPITSGLSFWGGWNAEEADSRGAANHEELVANSQEEGEKDDPSKAYWFIKEEAIYEHPYMEKAGKEQLRKMEKEFNEKHKKPKKKRS